MKVKTQPFPTTYASIFYDLSKQANAQIGSRFASIGGSFVTHIFLGQFGSTTLAAGASITAISRQFSSFIIGILVNAAIKMNANLLSGNTEDFKKVGERYQQALVLATLLALPAMAFMAFTKPILISLGQPEDVSAVVQTYFRAFVWGFAPLLWTFLAQQLAIGLKKAKVVLASGVFQSIALVGISYPLMFGKMGFSPLGAAGLGYAIGIVSLLNFIALSGYFYLTGASQKYHLHHLRLQTPYALLKGIGYLFKTGLPVGIQVTSELFTLLGITLLAGLNGKPALGATQVALQYFILMAISLSNGAQVAGIFVKQAVAGNQPLAAQRYGQMSLLLGGILTTLFATILFSAAPSLSKLFIKHSDPDASKIQSMAVTLLYIVAVTQVPDTLRYSYVSALRGLQDLTFAAVVSVTCIVMLTLGAGACFDFGFEWGVTGLFLGRALGVGLGTALMARRWGQKSHDLFVGKGVTPFFKRPSLSCCETSTSQEQQALLINTHSDSAIRATP